MARVVFARDFLVNRSFVSSARQRDRIDEALRSLARMPLMGTTRGHRRSVLAHGTDVRRLIVGPYIIVYRYNKRSDTVRVLDLMYGPNVR